MAKHNLPIFNYHFHFDSEIFRISENGLYGGQDKGSEIEMVWTCEEEMRRQFSVEVREVGIN
ncbi:hypothetical protein H5410_055586, partial [Solanum commersonii]